MHTAAYEFIRRQVKATQYNVRRVLEYGSRNVNGSVRPIFANPRTVSYWGIDLVAGADVNEVADAATYKPRVTPNAIVCCEVLEHSPSWRAIIANAWKSLGPGGLLFLTCACDPRPAHSATGDPTPHPDEYYQNINPIELLQLFQLPTWGNVSLTRLMDGDLQLLAMK
jgi:hypothetical protein